MARRKKRRKKEEADLDITPMIDVTFLLLIYFMVTSTMQPVPNSDIPPSQSGENLVKTDRVKDVTIQMPRTGGDEGEFLWGDQIVTLDQLKAEMMDEATGELTILLYAGKEVPNGIVGEVGALITEVAKETETEIKLSHAVKGER